MKTIRLIETFLEGKLEGEELNDFQERLKTNSSLSNEVQLSKEINESIVDNDAVLLRQQIKKQLNSKKGDSFSRLKIFAFVTGIAATLVLCFSLYSLTRQPDYNKAYAVFYNPYETDLSTRSAEGRVNEVKYAYLLYQNGDYKTAYELLKKYNSNTSNNFTALFFYGLSSIEVGDYMQAEKNFQEICIDMSSPYTLHAQWYLSLLYLKTGKPENAEVILKQLITNDNYYSLRAKQILHKYF